MGTPNLGYGSGSVGFGVESSWGTAVARSNWIYARSIAVRRVVTHEAVGAMGYSAGVDYGDAWAFVRSDIVRGTIEWDLAYDDSSVLLLHHALGKVTTTGPVSTAYTHTIVTSNPADWPVGLTIERIFGQRGATKDAEVYSGCVITSLELSGEPGSIVRARAEFIGRTSAGRTTAGTPSHHSGEPSWVLHHHAGNLDWSEVDDAVKTWRLSVDRSLDVRQLYGSLNSAKPYPTGKQRVTLSVTREYDENTAYGDYLDGTQGAAVLVHDGAGDNLLTMTLANARLMEYDDPTSSPGVTDVSMTLQAFTAGGTTPLCTLAVKNANATAATN